MKIKKILLYIFIVLGTTAQAIISYLDMSIHPILGAIITTFCWAITVLGWFLIRFGVKLNKTLKSIWEIVKNCLLVIAASSVITGEKYPISLKIILVISIIVFILILENTAKNKMD